MDYKKSAGLILEYVGGEKNVINFEHCSTRLRFTVLDKGKVNTEELKKVEGVMGLVINAQIQIIIGNNVIEVYDEIMKIYTPNSEKKESIAEKKKITTLILEYVIGIFQPLVPAMAGAGVLKSLLILFSTIGILDVTSDIYKVLMSIGDATFYFLPLMVAVTTATKLNTNKLVALVAGAVFLFPTNINLLSNGMTLFGFGVKNITYTSQVFPAILTVLFLGVLEKYLNKISPKAIRVFFVPMVSLAITIPISYLILGPLGFTMGEYLTVVILFVYEKFGFIAVALLAGILPFMIAAGMHKAFIPYATASITTLGMETLYLPASLAHNISQSGACFAVAVRAKDKQLKSAALSAGISALMGITEPALYGVTLLHKRVLYGVITSCVLAGGVIGYFSLKAFVLAGPGLPNITMFIDPNNSKNIIYGIIGFILSLVLSFIFTLLLWKEEEKK